MIFDDLLKHFDIIRIINIYIIKFWIRSLFFHFWRKCLLTSPSYFSFELFCFPWLLFFDLHYLWDSQSDFEMKNSPRGVRKNPMMKEKIIGMNVFE